MKNLLIAHFLLAYGQTVSGYLLPWIIVNALKMGDVYYTVYYAMISFYVIYIPFVGYITDRFSQVKMLSMVPFANLFFLIISLILVFFDVLVGSLVLFGSGFIVGPFQYNLLYAYSSLLGDNKKRNSGLIEIQVQLSATLGAITSLLINYIKDLEYKIIAAYGINAIGSILSIFFFRKLDRISGPRAGKDILTEVALCTIWFIRKVPLFVFCVASLVFFIVLLIWEQYVILKYTEGAIEPPRGLSPYSVYVIGIVVYCLGAAGSGIFASTLNPVLNIKLMMIYGVMFLLAILMLVVLPSFVVYVLSVAILGISNAGARISRVNLIWAIIPYKRLGRVSSVLNGLSTILRVVITGTIGMPLFHMDQEWKSMLITLLLYCSIAFLSMVLVYFHLIKSVKKGIASKLPG